MKVRYICAQPATLYYAWQVEVMLNNFQKNGINLNHVDIVCSKVRGEIPSEFIKLTKYYPARFFFYDDTRRTKYYISSIRPHILSKHFKKYPELSKEVIFYHDCDIVFSKPFDFTRFLYDEKWYGSDVNSYISHDYIQSKGDDILNLMCEIMEIDKDVVKANQNNCIGAQYLIKNVDYIFWDEVEHYSELLYNKVSKLSNSKKKEDPNYHTLQIWCADMWAVLWMGWKKGFETVVHKDFDFTWATSSIDQWEKNTIFHNAGVTCSCGGLFYKAKFMNELPYGKETNIGKEKASYMYWKEVEETGKKSVLI